MTGSVSSSTALSDCEQQSEDVTVSSAACLMPSLLVSTEVSSFSGAPRLVNYKSCYREPLTSSHCSNSPPLNSYLTNTHRSQSTSAPSSSLPHRRHINLANTNASIKASPLVANANKKSLDSGVSDGEPCGSFDAKEDIGKGTDRTHVSDTLNVSSEMSISVMTASNDSFSSMSTSGVSSSLLSTSLLSTSSLTNSISSSSVPLNESCSDDCSFVSNKTAYSVNETTAHLVTNKVSNIYTNNNHESSSSPLDNRQLDNSRPVSSEVFHQAASPEKSGQLSTPDNASNNKNTGRRSSISPSRSTSRAVKFFTRSMSTPHPEHLTASQSNQNKAQEDVRRKSESNTPSIILDDTSDTSTSKLSGTASATSTGCSNNVRRSSAAKLRFIKTQSLDAALDDRNGQSVMSFSLCISSFIDGLLERSWDANT